MKLTNALLLLAVMAMSNTVWAYGSSSSSKKACAKPKFSEFTPANNAQIAVGGHFSFVASANTNPDSLEVTVKGSPVAVTVTAKNSGFAVDGSLPASITADFVRINISADGHNDCKGNDGWLLKVD